MIKDKKNLIFWGIVVLVGAGLVLYGYSSKPESGDGALKLDIMTDDIQSPASDSMDLPEATPFTKNEESFIGANGIKAPATCQISGETEFSEPGLYSSNTKLSWQNIDSQGRLIKWLISPNDGLAIGPNIFGNLTIPNGEYENLTIRLPEKPVSKNYLLTASVTYGQFVDGDLKIKEANCEGQVKINLNF